MPIKPKRKTVFVFTDSDYESLSIQVPTIEGPTTYQTDAEYLEFLKEDLGEDYMADHVQVQEVTEEWVAEQLFWFFYKLIAQEPVQEEGNSEPWPPWLESMVEYVAGIFRDGPVAYEAGLFLGLDDDNEGDDE